jgi:hypothetical protein
MEDFGVISCVSASAPNIVNTIFWNDGSEIYGDSISNPQLSYCNVQGGWEGEGNIDLDPMFVDPEKGNYRLQLGSPCIDAANSADPAPATDKDGDARYDDPATEDTGAGAVTYYDMGAYEYLGSGTALIDLTGGWNLISLNFQPNNPAISEVLGTVANNCNSVWMFNNGWKAYYPAFPEYSDLDTMETGWGYWLNMSTAVTLPISGTTPSGTVSLESGWNLVGCNSSTPLPIAEAIETITTDCESVWVYKNGGWKAYYPAFPEYSDLETMEPNYGYWIKTTQACTWTLP